MGFGIATLIIGLIGTAISTYAAYEQSQGQQRAAKSEAQLREQEATSMQQAADYQAQQYRRRIDMLLGKQHAITAAAGLDPTSGSPLLMELANVRQAKLEETNIRRTGEVAASGRNFEARLARYRANLYGQAGTYALIGGAFKIGESILGGWSNYYNQTPDTSNTRGFVRGLGKSSFQFGVSEGD
jgi:hypothetical protein